MKIIYLLFVFLIISCDNQNKSVESISITENTETTLLSKEIDTNFFDFFYKFANEKDFQVKRTKICNWNYVNFFKDYEYSTHFYSDSNYSDEFSEKDKTVLRSIVQIELKNMERKEFLFKKINNIWLLDSIIATKFVSKNSNDFETFLYKLSKDSNYRKNHIKYPLKVETLNDDYNPEISYIQKEENYNTDFFNNERLFYFSDWSNKKTSYKMIWYRGLECGISNFFYFELKNGEWLLTEERDNST